MSFWDFLFPRETDVRRGKQSVICPVCMQERHVNDVSWSGLCSSCASELSIPLEEREERNPSIRDKFDWENMWTVTPTGITYKHDRSDPQKVIPQLYIPQQVFFHWDKTNANDPISLKIFTADEQYIGWYPKNGYRKMDVLCMIEQRTPYSVFVIKTYQQNSGLWGYDIVVVPSRPNITPETLPIPEFKSASSAPYYAAFMHALYQGGVIHLDWVTFTESSDSLTFQIGKIPFCIVKHSGRLTYCTSMRSIAQCSADFPAYQVEAAPKSFGIFKTRIFIHEPNDLIALTDSIFQDFKIVTDTLHKHGQSMRPKS